MFRLFILNPKSMYLMFITYQVNPHKDTRIEGETRKYGVSTPLKPSNRERESAYYCITDRRNWNCRTVCMCNYVSRRYDFISRFLYVCVVSLITKLFCEFKALKPFRKRRCKLFLKGSCASTWRTSENREYEGALHWLVMLYF